MSTEAAAVGRGAAGLRERLRRVVRATGSGVARTAAAARPWLRRETWTPENLAGVARSARAHPVRSLAVLVLLAGLLALPRLLFPALPEGLAVAEVQEGTFRVTIAEPGTLQALRSVTYASAIQSNQAKIIALAPEGRLVQKGDLLILFDPAPFEEEIRRSHAQLGEAQAELEKARQDLNLQAVQNAEEVAAARQRVEKSELELLDVEQGKGRVRLEEAKLAVGNAERELQKAKGAYEDLKPLLEEGFITRQELDRAQQSVQRAEEDLALAKQRHDSLQQFGRPLELSQARAEASLTRESLRQLEAAAAFRLTQKRAAISAAESRIQEASSRLSLAQQQLARTEARADVPGIVVYREVYFGSEQRKPQVGDQVWANQPLLILPDISKMVVETRVRETDVHKVEKNQRVGVRVQAYPDLRLTGKVTLVGTLAQEEKDRRGAKFFNVTIELQESEPRLRPGMTATVEIEVEERGKALFVPVEAVFERGPGRHVCYVSTLRGIREREVVLGPANRDFVVIERGVRRGERVALRDPAAPPTDFGSLTGS
ncbi:MAG TPA: efflux RND transporter periplasmic adaptor subunit [Vicinamibacteria bacterium]|nr:efflux RND transporter periplasmic adaptor subunit [Vicinamibacteria bacterium]